MATYLPSRIGCRFALYKLATALAFLLVGCLPPSEPYPYANPDSVVTEAEALSDDLESYIYQWMAGDVPAAIPDDLIPTGISDSENFYLKDPDAATLEETWAVRYATPINKDSLYAGIPDPNVTYLFLGTALAPFGSKLVLEGEFPHCRFFSIQVTPPLNGKEYYAQRQFGTAEVSLVDADIEPLPGHTNPFRPGADRTATQRSYRVEIDLATGDPVALNGSAHTYPYRQATNTRTGGMLTYQGPLGYETVAGTPLPPEQQGDWNLGALWLRIYLPDADKDALGGVPMPKAYFELPTGERYFIGSDFSTLQERADATIANRTTSTGLNPNYGPTKGWYKSWGITRSMLNGVCIANGWDSTERVRAIDLGWTGRGEFRPAPGNIEPHATTNNYASYIGRAVHVPPGHVAVLTGKLPTFPATRAGEAQMTDGDVRYWSIVGVDTDPLSPMPATTVHAIVDDEVQLDTDGNYTIVYSRPADRPVNATASQNVSWVDWGNQNELGMLMRWVCVAPDWRFELAPHEHNLGFSRSDFSGTQYDPTLLAQNWHRGFMGCYLPRIHYLTTEAFEALGDAVSAATIPVWVDDNYTQTGLATSRFGNATVTSLADTAVANAASNLNDADLTTFWSSAWGEPAATATIDLGEQRHISAVKLHWDWIFFGKQYALEVSDDNTVFTEIVTLADGNGAVDLYKNLQGVTGRYIRLRLQQPNIGYYRLAEFEVFTSDVDCATLISHTAGPDRMPPSLEVFPNPASRQLYLRSATASTWQVRIFDLSGRLMLQRENVTAQNPVPVRRLKTGTYIVVATDMHSRATVSRKIIKQ